MPEPEGSAPPVEQLLARSRALGSDPRVTNYGGGNTSVKAGATDPVTGDRVEVLWVKGSGGDLGTLEAAGLAALRLDRVRQLERVYRGPKHEDEMVEHLAHCNFGGGGAAPSIDTAMHGLVDAAHVDHLHPDSIIAFATALDGEALTKECFGGTIGWVPWRRPGFELGVRVKAMHREWPGLEGVVLQGHGLTTWAETSDECRERSLSVVHRAERFIAERGRPEPFGQVVHEALPAGERRSIGAALAPVIRGLCSTDRRMVGCFNDSAEVLEFVGSEAASRLVPLGTSCPDHLIRTRPRPLLTGPLGDGLLELHAAYREEYAAYYRRHATLSTPPMRGADPTVVLVAGVGMFSFGPTARDARITGEFYVNAINAMRGAEAVSTYRPIEEDEKFRIEYWQLEEAKLRRMPPRRPLTGRVALVTGGASGIGKAVSARLAAEGAAVVIADREPSEDVEPDVTRSVVVDVTAEDQVHRALTEACLAFGGIDIVVNNAGLSISKSLFETTLADWDVQHDVMARGSFLVSREAARILVAQGLGGDIVYVVSKNAVVAGPNNVAYGAAKADQAHQVRLLAAELGQHSVRVNGVNPDGVVKGSGIFASGWGAERAKVYGVREEELGRFYAERTLLNVEVLPEHVAAAVFAFVGGNLSLTTGTIIPVDGGVPMAFVR